MMTAQRRISIEDAGRALLRREVVGVPDNVRQALSYYRLRDLVRMALLGRLRPASFSRPQVWSAGQVVDLFDSILHGYPIGTLVAIEEPAPEQDVVFADIVLHVPHDENALIIIDGLQRITTLVKTLSNIRSDYKDKRFEIYYDIDRDKFGAGLVIRDSMLPVRTAANSSELTSWIREHPFLSESDIDACWRVSGILNDYMVPMITLAGYDARNAAFEIFRIINTSGASLTKSDIARARSNRFDTVDPGLERLQAEVERTGFGHMSANLAAECAIAAAEESDEIISRGTSERQRPLQIFQQMPASVQRDALDRARKTIIPAVYFLRQVAVIPHIKLLPRPVIFPILIRYVGMYDSPAGRAAELIRRWIWRCGTVSVANMWLQLSAALDLQETALSSATSLLDSLPSYPGPHWRPDASALRLRSINGRLNTLALLALRPRLLVPVYDLIELADVPISATQIFAPWLDEASSAFSALLPRSFIESRPASIASYVLHPRADQAQLLEAVMAKGPADADILAGHCIDSDGLAFLQRSDFDEFVEHRQRLMFEAILRRVQSIARWGFRDRGSLPDLRDDSRYTDEYSDEY
jgi:Protein of unknown function DUF262